MQASISTYSFNSSATNCIPDLPVIANANAHYYDDVENFAVCLPTKTGSTNWLKFFYSLSIDHNSDPDDLDGAIIYSIPEMPRPRDELKEFYSDRTGENKLVNNQRKHNLPTINIAISQ